MIALRPGSKFRSFDSDDDEQTSWIESYSDLMTDLLAIFVILFSFAMINQAISASNTSAEAVVVTAIDSAAVSQSRIVDSMNAYIEEAGLSGQLSAVKQGDVSILLRIADSAFFESGKADIGPKAEAVLGNISAILNQYAASISMIRIEGHTDNVPISTGQFRSNWALSTSRAVNVLARLVEDSVLGPEQFSAVGYGEFHPVAGNDTAQGRAQNRRVDFIINVVKEDVKDQIPSEIAE